MLGLDPRIHGSRSASLRGGWIQEIGFRETRSELAGNEGRGLKPTCHDVPQPSWHLLTSAYSNVWTNNGSGNTGKNRCHFECWFNKLFRFSEVVRGATGEPDRFNCNCSDGVGTGAVLGGIEEVQSGSVWPEVMEAVLYVGDSSAGPSSTALKSGQFTSLVELLKAQVDTMVKTSATIETFWLSNGHPAYPVFWDFAFLFRTDATATIFIGASSD